MFGSGYRFLTVIAFSRLKSITIRSFVFFFGTNIASAAAGELDLRIHLWLASCRAIFVARPALVEIMHIVVPIVDPFQAGVGFCDPMVDA